MNIDILDLINDEIVLTDSQFIWYTISVIIITIIIIAITCAREP